MDVVISSARISFIDLSVGDCLIYGNNVFIKINLINDEFNAISLRTGEPAYFGDDESVTKVNKIIVEY